MNQTTYCIDIKTLANLCGDKVLHIPNPRVENEEHQMEIHNDKFLKLLGKDKFTIDEIKKDISQIKEDMNIELLPNAWQNSFDGILKPTLIGQ